MKICFAFVLCTLLSLQLRANNKILFYFNHRVDTSVSTGTNAVYLNNCLADTFVAYINRAKYSVDIAQYGSIRDHKGRDDRPIVISFRRNEHRGAVRKRLAHFQHRKADRGSDTDCRGGRPPFQTLTNAHQ